MKTSDRWPIRFDNLPAPREADKGNFSTEIFLHSLFSVYLSEEDTVDFQILDRLCKKIDVTRRLRAFYTQDLSRNAHPIADVQPEYFPLAASVLLSFAQTHRDLKFLNSALKLLDTKLVQPTDYAAKLNAWAASLIVELVG